MPPRDLGWRILSGVGSVARKEREAERGRYIEKTFIFPFLSAGKVQLFVPGIVRTLEAVGLGWDWPA